jgi:hypothetical protein
MTSIAKKMPWLLPLEISELVLKYYSRVPRCTRLTEPKQQELELTFDQQEEHHAR